MKSSRSTSSKITSRKARTLMSESSDDIDNGDDKSSLNKDMDSSRAEKAFSRRRRPKPTINSSNVSNKSASTQSIHLEKTLFKLSDTSDSEESLQLQTSKKNLAKYRTILQSSDDELSKNSDHNELSDSVKCHDNKTPSDDSSNVSFFKPSKRDLAKYRTALISSDDEPLQNSDFDGLSDTSLSTKGASLIESDECIEETTYISANKKLNIKQSIILDSYEEKQTMSKSDIFNETNLILDSNSENNIINSTNQRTKNIDHEDSQIETKLKDLSLIEPSDSDDDFSAGHKSTVASSYQNRPFFVDDLKLSTTAYSLHDPISQSSMLEYSNSEKVPTVQSMQINKNKKLIDIIDLVDDSPKVSKVCPPKEHNLKIDLTDEPVDDKSYISMKDKTEKINTADFQSLKMEKIRLEEILRRYTKNIDNMKITMKNTNLNLLPDGGYKLKKAIIKEESALTDTRLQLKNVLQKLEGYPEESKISQAPHTYTQPLDIKNALIKKAAGNIDINAMGDKALGTYRTQQTMTLDVLNTLHKSLGTCPSPNVFAEDPKNLKVELMPHQKHGIAWLMWRESQKPHGGVLADDMGLGKTLTMISLILKASEDQQDLDEDSDMDDSLENSNRNSLRGGTIIICPSSLLNQWQGEVKSKVKSRILEVFKYYGPNRESSARRLACKDIVITTYQTVMWDHKNAENSPLFKIKWNRIILDEAHTIRNPKSQTSLAVVALSGINRWALTGTPIHNKEADFYALLKFIRCRPFDEWAVWKRWVGNNDEAGKNRLSLITKTLMLRRTKDQLKETTSFKLPPKTFHTIKVDLFQEEKDAYEKVLLFSRSLFSTYLYEKAEKENAVERGFPIKHKAKYLTNNSDDVFKDHPELDQLFKKLRNNKEIQVHHILVLILRLRQLCCHPCLLKNMLEGESLKVDGIQDIESGDIVDKLSRMSISIATVKKDAVNSNLIFKESWVSSKIKAVCDMVKEKVLHSNDKAVIVSQWPSVLKLVNDQLSQYNVKTELFCGAVPVLNRNKIVDQFNEVKGGPKILLLSLTAGGVGLNLVAANHLFLVDIHWNPQLEAQACDRIYRLGQQKPVNVYKFICTDTIEASIQLIQTKKLQIANNIFGGSSNVEGSKITLEDLKEIFNINPNKVKS